MKHGEQSQERTVAGRRVPALGDATWLRQRYVVEGASIAVIARELGCAIGSVRSALAAAAIPMRPSGPRRKLAGLQREEAVRLVREHGMAGAARRLNVTTETFRAAVGWLGAREEVREASWAHERERRAAGVSWPAVLHDRDSLAAAYEAMTVTELAAHLGVAHSVVTKALQRQGIATSPGRRRQRPHGLAELRRPPDV